MMPRSANRAHAIAGEDIAAPRMLKLIRAAENIFLVKGYHTATMSEVAKAAGMSKKTVYQLVESKADLFSALFAHHDSLLTLPVLPPDWTASEVLTENLLCLGRFLLRPEQIALVRLIVAEHVHDPEFGALFYQKRVLKARSQLELCLAGMARRQGPARQGNARRGVAEMAALLFGLSLGEFYLGSLLGFRNPPARATLEKRVRGAVEMFLRGSGCFLAPPISPASR